MIIFPFAKREIVGERGVEVISVVCLLLYQLTRPIFHFAAVEWLSLWLDMLSPFRNKVMIKVNNLHCQSSVIF